MRYVCTVINIHELKYNKKFNFYKNNSSIKSILYLKVLKTYFSLIFSVFDELGCPEHVLGAVELSLSRLQDVLRSYRGFGNGHRE